MVVRNNMCVCTSSWLLLGGLVSVHAMQPQWKPLDNVVHTLLDYVPAFGHAASDTPSDATQEQGQENGQATDPTPIVSKDLPSVHVYTHDAAARGGEEAPKTEAKVEHEAPKSAATVEHEAPKLEATVEDEAPKLEPHGYASRAPEQRASKDHSNYTGVRGMTDTDLVKALRKASRKSASNSKTSAEDLVRAYIVASSVARVAKENRKVLSMWSDKKPKKSHDVWVDRNRRAVDEAIAGLENRVRFSPPRRRYEHSHHHKGRQSHKASKGFRGSSSSHSQSTRNPAVVVVKDETKKQVLGKGAREINSTPPRLKGEHDKPKAKSASEHSPPAGAQVKDKLADKWRSRFPPVRPDPFDELMNGHTQAPEANKVLKLASDSYQHKVEDGLHVAWKSSGANVPHEHVSAPTTAPAKDPLPRVVVEPIHSQAKASGKAPPEAPPEKESPRVVVQTGASIAKVPSEAPAKKVLPRAAVGTVPSHAKASAKAPAKAMAASRLQHGGGELSGIIVRGASTAFRSLYSKKAEAIGSVSPAGIDATQEFYPKSIADGATSSTASPAAMVQPSAKAANPMAAPAVLAGIPGAQSFVMEKMPEAAFPAQQHAQQQNRELHQQQPGEGNPLQDGAVHCDGDVEYGTHQQRVSICQPKGPRQQRPAIMLVRGVKASKARMLANWQAFLQQNFVVAVLDYRSTSCSEDLGEAVEWLRGHHDKYGVDPARIGIHGYAAGGVCAASAALSGAVHAQAIASIAGAPDTTSIPQHTSADFTPMPPFFFVHAKDDDVMPFKYAEETVRELTHRGISAFLLSVESGGHTPLKEHEDDIKSQTIRFFINALGHVPASSH